MLGDTASSGLSGLNPPAASLTTIPLDTTPLIHHRLHYLHCRATPGVITIIAPRKRHLLPALAGVMITCLALGFAVLRLATLPVARDHADRVGTLILLILPCGFGLAGLFALLPLICPPRLRLDAEGATLTLPSGFGLCRKHLPPGTFELRTHEWICSGPAHLATLFLRDRKTHATYPIFHKYPAADIAKIMLSLARPLTSAPRTA